MEAKVDTAAAKAAATSTNMPGASAKAIQGMKRHTATRMNDTIGTATTVAGAETEKKVDSTCELDLSRKSADTTKESKRPAATISATSTTLHRAAMEAKVDTAVTIALQQAQRCLARIQKRTRG